MTGIERLVATAAGGPVDRIPVFCNLLDQGARELGVSLREYYANGEHVAEAQLKMRERLGYDNVWSLFYVGREAELLGCREIVYADDGPPNVAQFVVQSYDDIAALQVPESIEDHPCFQENLRCLRILRSEVGGKYPICAYLTSSATLPAMLMGMERWLELLLIGPAEPRDELLSKCSEFFRKELAAYRAAGADLCIYADPFASTDFVPVSLIESVAMPWMAADLDSMGTHDIVYYCGGARMGPMLPRLAERFAMAAWYLSPMDDLPAGKAALAGRGLCAGVINDILLLNADAAQTRAEVRRIIAEGHAGGRFLFGTLVMPYAIPEATIRCMLEAAYEYGRCDGAASA